MTLEETIEYLEQLLDDESLPAEVKLGISEALKKLKKDRSLSTIKDVIEIIAALLGIGSHI